MAVRFNTIVLTFDDGSGTSFGVSDARFEIDREVNKQGRRTGASLSARLHIILDLNANDQANANAVSLFNISTQPGDVVQNFTVDWLNPFTGAGATSARHLTFSGWVSHFELYRPQSTGLDKFGTSTLTDNDTKIGRADDQLFVTFAIAVDDDNIANLVLST
jgi:hypothetical protein